MVSADVHLMVSAVLGLIVGSFLNVVIVRLPVMQAHAWRSQARSYLAGVDASTEDDPVDTLSWPPSHCMHCQHRLAWWHNLPILSFCLLRGRCAYCTKAIAWFYPLVECVTLCVTVGVYAWHGESMAALAWVLFAWYGVVISVIDWQHHLIPDVLSLGLLWWGLLFSACGVMAVSPSDAILGAVAGYGSMRLVAACYVYCRGREGLGGGDFKLLAACGAWLGWQLLPWLVSMAAIAGVVVAGVLWCSGRMRYEQPMAFGPYLVIAALVVMLCPELAGLGWLG